MLWILCTAMGHRVSRGVPACLALLLVSLFAGACGEDAPTEAYEVSGYVTELGSGEGVGRATVTFTSDTRYTAETRTGSDGFYEMVVETDSLFGQVSVEAEGFEPAEASVFFDQRTRRVDVGLKPDDAPDAE